jgi:SAM-dependent methyltransferase
MVLNNELVQESMVWDKWWEGITPLTEIQMWDFYGGRQWIAKYTPRFGKVIEAGCGLGRNVFYLRRMGIDIDGLDFSKEVIERLKVDKKNIDPNSNFISGDVESLPFADDSLSGYLSLGVVEHFQEGPQLALKEAHRVLRPGGVGIISTPNLSFSQLILRIKRISKDFVKKIVHYPPRQFFQNEYAVKTLMRFVTHEGFFATRYEGCDLFYAFRELFKRDKNISEKSIIYKLAINLERTHFRKFGAQSIVIAVKPASLMYCFLCGDLVAKLNSLDSFDVPICGNCQNSKLAICFSKRRPVLFAEKYIISPPILKVEKRTCSFSGEEYETDPIFEDYGFNRNVSPKQLVKPIVNMELCTKNLKPIFRRRNLTLS